MWNEVKVNGFDSERGIQNGDLILYKFPLGNRYRVFLVTGFSYPNKLRCKIKNCDIKVLEYDKICDMMKFDAFEDKLDESSINKDSYIHIYKYHVDGTFRHDYKVSDEVYDIFDPNDGGGPAVRYLTILEASDKELKATEMISKESIFTFTPEDENQIFFSHYETAGFYLDMLKGIFVKNKTI